jgi:hypothetical protein
MATEEPKKYLYVCSYCGTDNVTSDATAEWDFEKQDWVLNDVNDYSYCGECGDEAALDDIYPEDEEKKAPIGTSRAILVDEVRNPSNYWGNVTSGSLISNEERFFVNDPSKAKEGELVVLKKTTSWQWEIVNGEEAHATNQQ